MNKGIADQFLREITDPNQDEEDDPRVILVRSNRNLKRFITSALEEVEHLVSLVQAPVLSWTKISKHLTRLASLAREHDQPNINVAADQISTLACSLVGQELTKDSALGSKFTDFVTYLSTMLLRVYIEGTDDKCTWELSSIELLLGECYAMAPEARAKDPRWLN
jgi:hypothetical protein